MFVPIGSIGSTDSELMRRQFHALPAVLKEIIPVNLKTKG